MPSTGSQKVYRETRDPGVILDVDLGQGIPRDYENEQYRRAIDLMVRGEAVLLPFEEPSVQAKRRDGYLAAGITVDAMTVALWEMVVEGRPASAQALQAARLTIKDRFPVAQR